MSLYTFILHLLDIENSILIVEAEQNSLEFGMQSQYIC